MRRGENSDPIQDNSLLKSPPALNMIPLDQLLRNQNNSSSSDYLSSFNKFQSDNNFIRSGKVEQEG